MARVIQVDVLLGIIEQAQTRFALESARQRPEGDHAAHYTHGVYNGMESIKQNVLNKMKEEDEREKKPVESGGRPRVY
jgi:hypothetical protein